MSATKAESSNDGVREKLADVLERHRGERHAIAIRGFPDPDSIGSAMAHAYINQSFDIESIIYIH